MNWLRYLGRERQLLALYDLLREAEGKARHPTELSPETGLDMHRIQTLMDGAPELFVKLPRNQEGLVRYRLTTSASTLSRPQVEQLVRRRARSEKLQVAAVVTIIACIGFIILITVIPATSTAF